MRMRDQNNYQEISFQNCHLRTNIQSSFFQFLFHAIPLVNALLKNFSRQLIWSRILIFWRVSECIAGKCNLFICFFSTHRRRKKEAGWWAFVNYMLYDINERAKKCIQRTDPAKVHRGENLINVHSINLELNYYTFLNHDFLLLEQWNKKL